MARVMKDSGIEWIGEIPIDWECTRISSLYSERNTKVSDKDYVPLSVTKQGIVLQLDSAAKTNDGDNRKLVCKGDFVINSRSDRRGSCGISDYDGSVSLINTVIHPKRNVCNDYFQFAFKTERFADEYFRWGNGIVDDLWSTKWSAFKRIGICCPRLDVRIQIANYLHINCARIDFTIEKQKTIIEKLKQYKQAIITEAVTKGLDPTVKMKPSGVEWIGEIPADWERKKIKYTSQIMRGKFNHRPRNDPRYYGGSYPFVQTGDVARAEKYITEYSQTLNDLGFAVSKQFPAGSVVLTIAANVGDVAILNFDACFPDSVVGFVPNTDTAWNYLYYCFVAMKNQLIKNAIISTQLNLNIEIIKEETIPFPNFEEQRVISQYLDEKCAKIDDIIVGKQKLNAQLIEYKKSLIYECVTGKREVG